MVKIVDVINDYTERYHVTQLARLNKELDSLYELQKDIVNFCIKLPKKQELKDLLKRLSDVDKTLQKTA